MMDFIALYRGPTVSEAWLVAVSSQPGVVGRFIRELAGEADSTEDQAGSAEYPPLQVVHGDNE